MNYIKIEKDNLLNGPGIRVVLWLAGCNHYCKNCHNMETWNPSEGYLFDDTARKELFGLLSKNYCDGLTLTGGDPFFPETRFELLILLNEIRNEFPDKNIWCWTGFTFEKLLPDFNNQTTIEGRLLSNIDVLIDGEYKDDIRKMDLKDPNSVSILKYRGSSNQRIINVQKTLKERSIVLWEK